MYAGIACGPPSLIKSEIHDGAASAAVFAAPEASEPPGTSFNKSPRSAEGYNSCVEVPAAAGSPFLPVNNVGSPQSFFPKIGTLP